jgi:hypothetical protein
MQVPGAAWGRPAGIAAGQAVGSTVGQAAGRTPGQGPAPPARKSSCMHNSAPKQNGNWTDSQLEGALLAYEHGCSVNGAATLFDIPRTSFRAHLSGTVLSRKRDAAPVLIEVEEQQLVTYLIDMQNLGFLLSISQLKLKVAFIT